MDIKFNSIEELYKRVYPALKSKVKELKRYNMNYIKEVDIWNSLIESKWKNTRGLLLSDMVDDILNTDNAFFDKYVKEKMKKVETEVNTNIEII